MLYLRRATRRIKGYYWTVRLWLRSLLFRYHLCFAHVSLSYLWQAFAFLVQMDMDDWYHAGRMRIRAHGLELHVVEEKESGGERVYEFVMFQDHNGQLVVHEWRDEKRRIKLCSVGAESFPVWHETNWHEVFRSGSHFTDLRFVDYIKQLYGKGVEPEETDGRTASI